MTERRTSNCSLVGMPQPDDVVRVLWPLVASDYAHGNNSIAAIWRRSLLTAAQQLVIMGIARPSPPDARHHPQENK